MALTFGPRRGMVLACDFQTGFKPPEMVKVRPVVIMAEPTAHRPGLCTVIPLSTTAPIPVMPYHHRMKAVSLPAAWGSRDVWAKCDMIYAVSCERLDRILVRDHGQRRYVYSNACSGDLEAIRHGILHSLGMGNLITPPS
ncbi:MAG TPA: type II toxin-antitoxin system PemK/MazF family toxin [Gammaproteobacteria bacterium]